VAHVHLINGATGNYRVHESPTKASRRRQLNVREIVGDAGPLHAPAVLGREPSALDAQM